MDLYRAHILDHSRNPRNWGLASHADAQSVQINPLCGDEVVVQVVLHDGRIRSMRFEGRGCAVSTASASLLSEYVVGKTEEEVHRMARENIEELLGSPLQPARVRCGLLALDALQHALARRHEHAGGTG